MRLSCHLPWVIQLHWKTRMVIESFIKKRHEAKIDNVAALMDAFVAYKQNKEAFE